MRDVWPEAISVLNFDYHARLVNIIITTFGFFASIFHFCVLIRKSLRSSPVFIIMLVICICDLFQLIVTMANDVKYLIDFNKPTFCLGFDTYYGTVLTMSLGLISGFSMFISSWLAVLMAFFRSLSIKFSMTSWSAKLANSKSAKYTSAIVIGLSFAFNLSACFFKYNITPKDPIKLCDFSFFKGAEDLYSMAGGKSNYNAILFFTLLDGIWQLFQLILFTYSSFFLSKFIRETAKNKILKSKAERQAEKTEGLILFTLVSFFISTLPALLANFAMPMFANLNIMPYIFLMSTTIMTMLQTLNASTHGIVCVIMSSQYRDVAKTAFSPRNSRNSSSSVVAPAVEDFSVVQVQSVIQN